ncbi:reverse transcriptase domain-containing protein [Tanacetum coccineum]
MHRDARDMIRTCNDCQVHRPVPRNPHQPLTPITAPWPFYKWGIDIAGPFPKGPGNVKFLIVAMDYFTKWIEAKAVATITGNQVKKLVWDNIVCRFSLPGEIVSDNVLENMDAYRDEGMGDVIVGESFFREVVSEKDEKNGISHAYQKLKGFYKGVLNQGPEYIRNAKTEEWLTRGHISVHEIE